MEKTLEFVVDDTILRGKMFVPKGNGPFPGVIFFHGSGGTGEMHFENAKKLSENGIVTFAINYRGGGLSEGIFEDQTIEMGIEDGRHAIETFLNQKEVDRNRLGFCGGSFGGFIAATLCNFFPVKSLLLEAPAAYSSEISKTTQRDSDDEIRRDNFITSESYTEIAKYSGNLLVVQCEFDDVLPQGMVEEYDKRATSVKTHEHFVLKGAKHRISINPEARLEFQKKVIEFFSKTL